MEIKSITIFTVWIFVLLLVPTVSADLNYTTLNSVFSNFSVHHNSEGYFRNSSNMVMGYINGSIDEVMIFNTALNSSQISDIYNNQSQRFKSQGQQTIKQVNITSGYNQINLTTSFNSYFGSNISARLGMWDVSLGYNNSDLNTTLNGLVAYYHFDEAAWNGTTGEVIDAMGLNNGTSQNATGRANTTGNGVYGRAGSFDGSNDYISVGNTGITSTKGSISLWVNIPSYSNYPGIFTTNDNGLNNAIRVEESINLAGTNRVYVYDRTFGAIAFAAFPVRTWTMLTLVWDENNRSLGYTNGKLSFNVSRNPNVTVNNLVIGRGYDTTRVFNGSIDEVMIFNKSLSSDEVKELYVKGRANWNYTNYQNLSTSGNIYNFSSLTTNLLPDFTFLAGNSSNPFYTPNIISNSISPISLNLSNIISIKIGLNIINESWQEIRTNLEYLNNSKIWIWADLENCNASDRRILRPKLEFKSYCTDCQHD